MATEPLETRTVKETAHFLGRSEKTIRRALHKKSIDGILIGREWCVYFRDGKPVELRRGKSRTPHVLMGQHRPA
jgi:excisionase family DNA binding protein